MNKDSKNILLVIDTACYNPVSMQAIMELAAELKVGIQALYVEDINLLTAVDLPFTREVSIHTARTSNINSTMMLQKLRADAEKIRKQIEEIALSHRVALSFSSARGQKTQIVRSRTQELSMALIPAAYAAMAGLKQLRVKRELAVVYDQENPSREQALNIALSQAVKNGYELFAIVDSEQSKQQVEQKAAQYGSHVSCQVADFSGFDEILLLLRQHSPKMLVLSEDSRIISDERVFQRLLNSLDSDILLVR